MSPEFCPAHFFSSPHYLLLLLCKRFSPHLLRRPLSFFSSVFSPNAHLIKSQAAFHVKSPSFNVFLLIRNWKEKLLSFKFSFFQEFYLFNHHTIHTELGQCEQQPLNCQRWRDLCSLRRSQNVSGMGVLQGHAAAIWAWSQATPWNHLQRNPYSCNLLVVLSWRQNTRSHVFKLLLIQQSFIEHSLDARHWPRCWHSVSRSCILHVKEPAVHSGNSQPRWHTGTPPPQGDLTIDNSRSIASQSPGVRHIHKDPQEIPKV